MSGASKPSRRESSISSVRWRLLPALGLTSLLSSAASAVPAHYSVSQLFHTQWTAQSGAPAGINYMAQTSDGFLWLATSGGLFRFDGVEFERFTGTAGVPLLSQDIYTLHATADGDLWIGHHFGGASQLHKRRLVNYGREQGLPPGSVTAFAKTPDGTIWAGTSRGLFQLEGRQWHLASTAWNTPTKFVDALLVDRDHTLWMHAGRDIFYLRQGAKEFEAMPDVGIVNNESTMFLDADGAAALCAHKPFGVLKLKAPPASGPYLPDWNHRHGRVGLNDECVFDKQGHLWVGGVEGAGRFLVSGEKVGSAADDLQRYKADLAPLSGEAVNQAREDREGNIWFGTEGGLDRFRTPALLKVPLEQHGSTIFMVAPAGDHGMWVGSTQGGVYRFDGTERQHIELGELNDAGIDTIYSTRAGALWAGGGDSIWQLQPDLRWRRSARLGTRGTGPAAFAYSNIGAMTQDAQGAMWVSVLRVGTYRVVGDKWTLWDGRTDMPTENANALLTDAKDRIWFGYNDGSVAVLDRDHLTMIADGRHMPPAATIGAVRSFAQEHDRMWIGSTRGLWRLDGKVIQPVIGDHGAFSEVRGIVPSSDGDLWLSTVEGVIHITSGELQHSLKTPDYRIHYQLLTYLDGLPGIPLGAAAGNDGGIWFATENGVVQADPSRAPRNPIAPTSIVKSMIADGVVYSVQPEAPILLPVQTHNLQISYTAPSLTMPERVMFRYRLAPADAKWQDVGNRRAAYFTDLAPGRYHFQVIAANNDGLWGDPSISIDFVIPPTFVQTPWFTALCVCVAGAVLWFGYLLRLRSVKTRLRLRLEERMVERERIARELHDTFLQAVQGLVLRFQSAMERIPPREPSRALMEDALDRADQVIADGRDAVTNLRATSSTAGDLVRDLRVLGERLSKDHEVSFLLSTDGPPCVLDPVVRQEAQRIAIEAMTNAFHHSQGTRVELSITYARRRFGIRVVDDGRGFDPSRSYSGHWGLKGMQERADRLCARLHIDSDRRGTAISLEVPAGVAYKQGAGLFAALTRLWRHDTRNGQ